METESGVSVRLLCPLEMGGNWQEHAEECKYIAFTAQLEKN